MCLSVSVCFAMASKHKLDSQDPHYQEGIRVALELKLDRVLAEARVRVFIYRNHFRLGHVDG